MEYVVIATAVFIIIMLSVLGSYAYYSRVYMPNQLEFEVREQIEEYKGRLNGENRFLFNLALMEKCYPEYPYNVRLEVWTRIVATRLIERDPFTGEWCIR